ncbi:hypothetical protein [Jeotgalibacillus salarius]|uniref:NadR/Ttd14 AAA domain-containing protein n=1 Tax=Jeotgalibacillus salarius TaxID=546023 RepID=A0A4Y8LJ32_9BACL|nr:hypothetical protein [Jeotgalibacillus salarius]TFE01711.1 hypothetical protein E2626_09080 [Jeotgalibacillus salarius]
MERIEFIGGPATGKSTLYFEMLKNRTDEDSFRSVTEVKKEIALTHQSNLAKNKLDKLFYLFLKMDLFKDRHHFMIDHLLRTVVPDILHTQLSDYDFFFKILIKHMADSGKLSPSTQTAIIDFYYKIIVKDVALLDFFDVKDTVIYEEGIIHNNEGMIDPFNYLTDLDHSPFRKDHLHPACVIHCDLDIDLYYERRIARIEKGHGIFLDKHLTRDELYTECLDALNEGRKKTELMEKLNIPLLRLDMATPIEDNTFKALNFIRSTLH